jgi:hypothetical protein
MLAFVRDELVQERDQTREGLEALGKQLELANRAASRFRTSLPNRDEAIAELNRTIGGAESEARPYIGIFVADVLSTLRLRHGNEISEYLLDEVGHRRLLALVPGGKIFRWSAQAVVAVWRSQKELTEISTEMAGFFQIPFDCRAFVGTRTATFRIAMRFLVLDTQLSIAKLVHTLDRFAKDADTR